MNPNNSMQEERQQKIAIVAHKFLTQPDDDFILFLNQGSKGEVIHICHSFSDAPDRRSSFVWYRNGLLYKQGKSADYKHLPESLIYFKELFFTMKWLLGSRQPWDVYIGMDGLLVAFGMLLRLFGRVKKLVFWAIDFVPEKRFSAEWKNKVYHSINTLGYRRSDEMWDISPRMAEARERFLGVTKETYRSHKVVPYGVWTERIEIYGYDDCEQSTLVFMGHLLEKQGVQLVIEAIPEILQKVPNFQFKIIGGGSYGDELMALAEKRGVADRCHFLGKIDDIRELEKEIARSAVAIAPYIESLDTWTYYADPGKVKTYLACGVPLLLTKIPWNAQEIAARNCGVIIEETTEDVAEKVAFLMDRERNILFRKNALEYAQHFNYRNLFQGLL